MNVTSDDTKMELCPGTIFKSRCYRIRVIKAIFNGNGNLQIQMNKINVRKVCQKKVFSYRREHMKSHVMSGGMTQCVNELAKITKR